MVVLMGGIRFCGECVNGVTVDKDTAEAVPVDMKMRRTIVAKRKEGKEKYPYINTVFEVSVHRYSIFSSFPLKSCVAKKWRQFHAKYLIEI
jgi:hypothetical protein